MLVNLEQAIEKIQQNDPDTRSPDFVEEDLRTLKPLFPGLITEGPDGAAEQSKTTSKTTAATKKSE